MHVEVRHFLTAILADIGDHPVSAPGNAGNIRNMGDHAGEGGLFIGARGGGKVTPVDIGPFRDHQNMNGTQRVDILEGECVLVLGDFLAGNFPAQDFREDVAVIIGHHFSSLWK